MPKLYRARWVLPITSPPIIDGAVAVDGEVLIAVGTYEALASKYPSCRILDYGEAAIIPGLVNTHSHLELTAMRNFLEAEETDFFAWLRKLTLARLEKMTDDDLYISASAGACEAVRGGVTCVGDASDSALTSLAAVRDSGLRGVVFQESFGPDARVAEENFTKLKEKIARVKENETAHVRAGVSPHAPYTVSAKQLEMIAVYSAAEELPLMMHVAESAFERQLLMDGTGPFATGYAKRGIEWHVPGLSSMKYLKRHGILDVKPLLTHCINVDDEDIQIIKSSGAKVAHCPKSNAKLGHGRAPFERFLEAGIPTGLGSDSVASNNICDLLEEARFAVLSTRAAMAGVAEVSSAQSALTAATMGGASALGVQDRTGSLEIGKQADFAAIGLKAVHQRPVYDPYVSLVFASSARDVIATVIAGNEIYLNGHVTTIDEQRIFARMNEIAANLKTGL